MTDRHRAHRSLWLTPRFLQERTSATAHGHAEALGRAVHEEVLSTGDRLATISVALAQRYYRRAPAAWKHFGAAGFVRWVKLGEDLATTEPICREGAVAFFAVPPRSFGSGGLETATAWWQLAREIAATSRKLGGIFLRTTSVVLKQPDGLARLRAWAAAGVSLYGQRGWQGEFLAQAYFSAAPRAALTLSPTLYQLWAGAGVAVHPAMKERDFFGGLPRDLHAWSIEERELFLRATLTLATSMPKLAALYYQQLTSSIRVLPQPARVAVLRIFARAAKPLPSVAELVPVVGALLQHVRAELLDEALALVAAAAQRFPDVTVSALRVLPRVYEEASPAQVREWFAAGLRLDPDNAAARQAFFALESRTSLKVLSACSTAVTLEEAQGLLRKYIQMLSGVPVSIRGVSPVRLCLPLEEFPAENEVALPLRIDDLGTHENNFQLYRFLAALLAGRREFATYAFVSPDTVEVEDNGSGEALWRYLDQPEHPPILEELFLLADAIRVYARLCAVYGGVSSDGRWIAARALEEIAEATRVGRDQLVDTLFALAIAGPDGPRPAWLSAELAETVRHLTAPLGAATATVQDAMQVAHLLALRLTEEISREGTVELDGNALMLERMAGESYLEHYFDEAMAPDGDARAPQVPSPQRPEQERPSEDLQLQLSPEEDDGRGGSQPISPEELKRLLDAGVNLKITQATGEEVDGLGMYITDLVGKIPSEQIEELRRLLGSAEGRQERTPRRWMSERSETPTFFYDEWDYHISDYRSRWCRLQEITLDPDSGEFYNQAMSDYASLVPEVRRQFQRIRPEMYRTVRGLEDGEDFDLNAVINAMVEARAGRAPSPKLYVARQREERDVATLFLLDMSASTDEALAPSPPPDDDRGGTPADPSRHRPPPSRARRIIDVTRAALVIMSAALEEIGDAYAIYGFSGHGRDQVEFYRVKSFAEGLTSAVKGRMGGIEPKRSTRMGAALRHAIEKMAGVTSRSKHLFLLSDGFPQDFDYGQDRRSNVYGIRDTAVALREAEHAGITPFCITVDKAGHDYLREMCDESRYLIIEDIDSLPQELPKIYQRIVRA